VSEQSYYLERENTRLKRLVADLSHRNHTSEPDQTLRKKWCPGPVCSK